MAGLILKIECSIWQRFKGTVFSIKTAKDTSDLSNSHVHRIFTLLLIKQIFDKNK